MNHLCDLLAGWVWVYITWDLLLFGVISAQSCKWIIFLEITDQLIQTAEFSNINAITNLNAEATYPIREVFDLVWFTDSLMINILRTYLIAYFLKMWHFKMTKFPEAPGKYLTHIILKDSIK